jgi:hypothetical protein
MKCAQENWRINGAPREVPLGTVYQEPSGYRYIKIRRDWTIGKAQRKSTTAWVPEHRVIVEQTLERPLTKDEIVHHRNGKKGDNRIENLQVMTRSEHMALHVKAETIGTLVLSGELEILGHSLEEILELIGK